MHHPDHNASPVNSLPPLVVGIVVIIALIELAFQAGLKGFAGGEMAIGWRLEAVRDFGFVDALFERLIQTGQFTPDVIWRFFTYPFIHVSVMHAVMAGVLMLALGNFTSRVFTPVALIITFLAASFAGAVAYGMINETNVALIGAYPPVYGLIGLYTWVLWTTARIQGENPVMAFRLIGMLMVLQFAFFAYTKQGNDLPSDIAGFVTGFALAPVLVPGGLMRLRNRLRGR